MIDCKDCDKEFRNKQALRIHQNKRHGEEDKFECPYCENEYENYSSLVRHSGRYCEGDSPEQLYADFCFDGEWPTCQCGCEEEGNFQNGSDKGYKFAKYKQGHYARDQEGGFWTEEGLKKSAETRRKQFESGEREPWNKGMSLEDNPENEGLQKLHEKMLKENNPERAKKISEALQGHEHSDETIQKLTEHWQDYWSNPEHRKEQSERRKAWMAENGHEFIDSSLEDQFEEILETVGIEYTDQKHEEIGGSMVGAFYDFYLPETDTYIEVHGDFWHCNPDAGYGEPRYAAQERNVKRDKEKRQWCEENDKDLLVFWETDINENRKEVIQKLLQHA